jgi:GTP:adenosylcobinamide-phosphate guanylyltransferase
MVYFPDTQWPNTHWPSAQWTAIILAGQRPGPDALADHFGTEWKALVDVCGQPMLGRVVGTLRDVPMIKKIVILAQSPDVAAPFLSHDGRVEYHQSSAGIASSIYAIAGSTIAPWPVLITTADHPLLTPEMVMEFLSAANADVSVAMVERTSMLARFPDAKRTWLKFLDGAWSGANLFALKNDAAKNALLLWANAEKDRKHAFKLFWHFGPVLALRAISRTIALRDALKKGGRRIGITAQLIPMADPCAAIDVDKLSDHQLVERVLKERNA